MKVQAHVAPRAGLPETLPQPDRNRQFLIHATYANINKNPDYINPAKEFIGALTFGHEGAPKLPSIQEALHPMLAAGKARLPAEIRPGERYELRGRDNGSAVIAERESELPAARRMAGEMMQLAEKSFDSLAPEIRNRCDATVKDGVARMSVLNFMRHVKGQDVPAVQIDLPAGASQEPVHEFSRRLAQVASRDAQPHQYTHVKAQTTAHMAFLNTLARSPSVVTLLRRNAAGAEGEPHIVRTPAIGAYAHNEVTKILYRVDDGRRTALGFLTQDHVQSKL